MNNSQKLVSLFLATAAVVPTAAQAKDTAIYAGLSGGIVDVQKVRATTNADVRVGTTSAAEIKGTVGYRFRLENNGKFSILRADLEISYSRTRIKSVSVNGASVTTPLADQCATFSAGTCTTSGNTVFFGDGPKVRQINALANLWLEIPVGKRFHPYVGGGLGATGVESEGEGKTAFTWQLGAGVAVDVTSHIAITADFRHRESAKLGDAFNTGNSFGSAKTNSYTAGVRVVF